MNNATPSPQRTPILIKTVATLVVLALVATILVPEFSLLTAFTVSGVYLSIGVTFSIIPAMSNSPHCNH